MKTTDTKKKYKNALQVVYKHVPKIHNLHGDQN